MSFLDLQVIREKKHLPHMPIVNLPLKEFIHILTAFYHLPISLVPFTHLLIDASKYAQEGLNYTLNYFLLKILQINPLKSLWITYI